MLDSLLSLAKTYGPVFELYVFKKRFVVISDSELIKEILTKRPKYFRRQYNIIAPFEELGIAEHSLFTAEGSTWRRLRRLLSAPFSKQNVNGMYPSVMEEITRLLKSIEASEGQRVENIGFTMMQFTLRTILSVALNNVDIDDFFENSRLIRDVQALFSFIMEKSLTPLPHWLWKLYPPAVEKKAKEANARLDKIIGRIVENEKREMQKQDTSEPKNATKKKKSFIQVLLSESNDIMDEAEGVVDSQDVSLTSEEVVANIKIMILAGSETTSVSLSWALYYLSIHKNFFDKAREEADLVLDGCSALGFSPSLPFCAACFKEVQRFKGAASIPGAGDMNNLSF